VRVAKAEVELKKASDFDQILINDVLENALKDAEHLVANFLNS
jgi:guanylate kinase